MTTKWRGNRPSNVAAEIVAIVDNIRPKEGKKPLGIASVTAVSGDQQPSGGGSVAAVWERTGTDVTPVNPDDTVNVDHIKFDLTPTVAHGEGITHWDDEAGTLEIGMPGGNVHVPVGQANLIRVKNTHGSDITKGEAVYFKGSTGTFPEVGKANATNHIVASSTIAVATEDITNNQFGYVTSFGLIRKMDTSWASADSTPAFLDTTDGVLTNTLPTQPDSQVFVAVVIRKHATEGVLFVKIIPQPNLDELSNVLISGIADGEGLFWDAASGTWQNAAGAVSQWDRTGTVLTPLNAGDTVEIDQTSTSGNALKVERDLASGDTDSPVVQIVQDNAGDNQVALSAQNDCVIAAIFGHNTHATLAGIGVLGSVDSSSNEAYGGKFQSVKTLTRGSGVAGYYDANEGTAPASPAATNARMYPSANGLWYGIVTGGGIHKLSNILTIQSKSAAYTALTDDDVIEVDASVGAVTITLYAVSGNTGRQVSIIKIDSSANAVTVDGNGAETINGATTQVINAQWDVMRLYNNGTAWRIG